MISEFMAKGDLLAVLRDVKNDFSFQNLLKMYLFAFWLFISLKDWECY